MLYGYAVLQLAIRSHAFVFSLYSGNVQKYSNPVFISPDTILDAVEEKNGPAKKKDDETVTDGGEDEKESTLKDESTDL